MIINTYRKAKCPHCGAKFCPEDDDAEFEYFSHEYDSGLIIEKETRYCKECDQKIYILDVFRRKKYKVSKKKIW